MRKHLLKKPFDQTRTSYTGVKASSGKLRGHSISVNREIVFKIFPETEISEKNLNVASRKGNKKN